MSPTPLTLISVFQTSPWSFISVYPTSCSTFPPRHFQGPSDHQAKLLWPSAPAPLGIPYSNDWQNQQSRYASQSLEVILNTSLFLKLCHDPPSKYLSSSSTSPIPTATSLLQATTTFSPVHCTISCIGLPTTTLPPIARGSFSNHKCDYVPDWPLIALRIKWKPLTCWQGLVPASFMSLWQRGPVSQITLQGPSHLQYSIIQAPGHL